MIFELSKQMNEESKIAFIPEPNDYLSFDTYLIGTNEIRINIIAIYSPVTAKKYGCKLKKKIGNINGKLDLDLNKLKRLFSENISQAIKNTENVDAINETSGFVKRKEIRFHK